MKKPDKKYYKITNKDVGNEFGNPDYVSWCEERIRHLENAIQNLYNDFKCDLTGEVFDERIENLLDIKKGLR